MRPAFALAFWLAAAGAAQAFDPNSPIFQAPTSREVGPDAPLKPTPGDPPGDLAFGAYQRGFYIAALREAEPHASARIAAPTASAGSASQTNSPSAMKSAPAAASGETSSGWAA